MFPPCAAGAGPPLALRRPLEKTEAVASRKTERVLRWMGNYDILVTFVYEVYVPPSASYFIVCMIWMFLFIIMIVYITQYWLLCLYEWFMYLLYNELECTVLYLTFSCIATTSDLDLLPVTLWLTVFTSSLSIITCEYDLLCLWLSVIPCDCVI